MRIILLLLLSSQVLGQNVLYRKVVAAEKHSRMASYELLQASSPALLPARGSLKLNTSALEKIWQESPRYLTFSFPFQDKNLTLKLLFRHSPTFRVTDAQGLEVFGKAQRFYGGVVEGDSTSLVAFTLSGEGISAYLYTQEGDFHLGRAKEGEEYSLKEMVKDLPSLNCAVRDSSTAPPVILEPAMRLSTTEFVNCTPVQVSFEVDYSLYLTAGSMEKAVAATTELFNKVALVFENESVRLDLQGIRIWDSPDPYRNLSDGMDVFYRFAEEMYRHPSREIAQLLTARFFSFGGVASGVDQCRNSARVGMNAGLDLSVNYLGSIPHEIGHGLGVFHTHNCRWPGGPIDNCSFTEDGWCNPGPDPGAGGTIMSYCGGDVIRNGFGVLPGNLLRKHVAQCWGSGEKPSGLNVVETRGNTAVLSWNHPLIDTRFQVEYRAGSSGAWKSRAITDTLVVIDSLIPQTRYQWRVMTGCSDYAESEFTTTDQSGYCIPVLLNRDLCDFRAYQKSHSITLDNHSLSLFNPCHEPYYFSQAALPDLTPGEHRVQINYEEWFKGGVQVAIWIDLDNNGEFEERERLYFTTERYMGPITGTFKIPETAASTRLRLSILYTGLHETPLPNAPCGTYLSGSVYDYRVNIVACDDRRVAENLQMKAMSPGVAELSWEHSSRLTFQVEYREKLSEKWISLPTRGKSVRVEGLGFGKAYEWRVKSVCGEYVSAHFIAPRAEYCVPDYRPDNADLCKEFGTGIRRFSIENTSIDYSSDCSVTGYTLHNNAPVVLRTGTVYTFALQFMNSRYPMHAAIWIDSNNDGIFNPDERVFVTTSEKRGSMTGQFSLPVQARNMKNTRMRVLTRHSIPPEGSCIIDGYFGETEDYAIHVEQPCSDWLQGEFFSISGKSCGGGGIGARTGLPENTPIEIKISNYGEAAIQSLTARLQEGRAVWSDLAEGAYTIHSATVEGCTMPFNQFIYFGRSTPVFNLEVKRNLSHCDSLSGTIGLYTNLQNGLYDFQYFFNREMRREQLEVKHNWAVMRNLQEGTYRNFQISNSKCILTEEKEVVLSAPEKPKVMAANSGPYYAGETIKLMASGGAEYAWVGPAGFSSPEQHPEIRWSKMENGGEYTVQVKDIRNCKNSAVTQVEIIPVLASDREEWVKVYPNPVTDVLLIQVPGTATSEVTLYNVDGREIQRGHFKQKMELKTKGLERGNYLLKIKSGEQEYSTRVSVL